MHCKLRLQGISRKNRSLSEAQFLFFDKFWVSAVSAQEPGAPLSGSIGLQRSGIAFYRYHALVVKTFNLNYN